MLLVMRGNARQNAALCSATHAQTIAARLVLPVAPRSAPHPPAAPPATAGGDPPCDNVVFPAGPRACDLVARSRRRKQPGSMQPDPRPERFHPTCCRTACCRTACSRQARSRDRDADHPQLLDHRPLTTASRRLPTASSSCAAACRIREMEAQVLDSNPTSSANAASPSRHSRSRCRTPRATARPIGSTSSTRPATSISATKSSRSLAACEGALLVVDAAQGVEAQSVANCYTAVEQGLEVVPVLNKIDLPTADIEPASRRRSRP